MNAWLWLAVALISLLALGHSVLGERYILIRLFRRADLPHLFGSDIFTRRTLRFAWHLTSVVWWGVAVVIVCLAHGDTVGALRVLAITSVVSGLIAAIASRGRHLAWMVFLGIGAAVWLGTTAP